MHIKKHFAGMAFVYQEVLRCPQVQGGKGGGFNVPGCFPQLSTDVFADKHKEADAPSLC